MLYLLQTSIPEKAHLDKGLQSIYGVGQSSANSLLKIYGLLKDARGKDLRRLHKLQLKASMDNFPRPLTADLKQICMSNCQRLIDIKSYKGRRHLYGYPVRGQRTHTNAKNQKRLHKRWILSTSLDSKTMVNKSNKNQKPKKQALKKPVSKNPVKKK